MSCIGRRIKTLLTLGKKEKTQTGLKQSDNVYSNFYFKLEDEHEVKEMEKGDTKKDSGTAEKRDESANILAELTTISLKTLPGVRKERAIQSWLNSLEDNHSD